MVVKFSYFYNNYFKYDSAMKEHCQKCMITISLLSDKFST